MINHRFEDFAQCFRFFAEQKERLRQLILVDPMEAIANVELSMKVMLDCFHSLKDAVDKDEEIDFDFWGQPLTSFVLRYRNAKHHNHAQAIRSAHRVAQDDAARRNYLLVSYPAGQDEEGGAFIEHYVSWWDYCDYLNSLAARHADSISTIRAKLSAEEFERFAAVEPYDLDAIFVNVVPIITGAGAECIDAIADKIDPQSIEAEYFLGHFREVGEADFSQPNYLELSNGVFGQR